MPTFKQLRQQYRKDLHPYYDVNGIERSGDSHEIVLRNSQGQFAKGTARPNKPRKGRKNNQSLGQRARSAMHRMLDVFETLDDKGRNAFFLEWGREHPDALTKLIRSFLPREIVIDAQIETTPLIILDGEIHKKTDMIDGTVIDAKLLDGSRED